MSKGKEKQEYFYRQAFVRSKEDYNSNKVSVSTANVLNNRMPRKARKEYSKREIAKLFKMLKELRRRANVV